MKQSTIKNKIAYLALILDDEKMYFQNIAAHPYQYGLASLKNADLKQIAALDCSRSKKIKQLKTLGLK